MCFDKVVVLGEDPVLTEWIITDSENWMFNSDQRKTGQKVSGSGTVFILSRESSPHSGGSRSDLIPSIRPRQGANYPGWDFSWSSSFFRGAGVFKELIVACFQIILTAYHSRISYIYFQRSVTFCGWNSDVE